MSQSFVRTGATSAFIARDPQGKMAAVSNHLGNLAYAYGPSHTYYLWEGEEKETLWLYGDDQFISQLHYEGYHW